MDVFCTWMLAAIVRVAAFLCRMNCNRCADRRSLHFLMAERDFRSTANLLKLFKDGAQADLELLVPA